MTQPQTRNLIIKTVPDYPDHRTGFTPAFTPDKVEKMAKAWDKWAEENNVTPLPRDLGVEYPKPD